MGVAYQPVARCSWLSRSRAADSGGAANIIRSGVALFAKPPRFGLADRPVSIWAGTSGTGRRRTAAQRYRYCQHKKQRVLSTMPSLSSPLEPSNSQKGSGSDSGKHRTSSGADSGSGGGGSTGSGRGGDGGGDPLVQWQRDGLPRLPSHLDYFDNYAADKHCPVCADDDEEERLQEALLTSHASTYTALPAQSLVLRSIDEHGIALLESLRRPKQLPSWWGKKHEATQHWLAEALESSAAHYIVIGLTLLDLTVVVTELILSSIFTLHDAAPHAVHTAEEALSWTSVAILCLFTAELLAKLAVFGHSYFTGSKWHLVDALVVVTSLTLELSLRGIAQEVASLLIFFRLWRILRVVHGVAEAMELNHESELEQHHRLVHGLQKDLAAEHRRVRQLEREVAALSGAAAASGIDVASILRLAAAAAAQPDAMLLQAKASEASNSGSKEGSSVHRGEEAV